LPAKQIGSKTGRILNCSAIPTAPHGKIAKFLACEIEKLRTMAIEERADAFAEFVSEADEFISKFLHLVSATALTHLRPREC